MNAFPINKRSYYNSLDLISEDVNLILNKHQEIAYNYLEIRYNIATNENYSRIDFCNDIDRLFLNNEKLRNVISDIVEEEYNLDLNGKSSGKINIELQVTDELNKTFLKSTILMRLVIPLICLYPSADDESETMTFDILKECIKRFDGNQEHALNKLFKIIYSRVYQTRYPDVVIWTYLKNMSMDLMIIVKKYFKVVIKNILPKIIHNCSVISYLDVVIRQKLKFLFTYKYPISYKPLKIETTDDDDLNEQERMEINLLRNDQGSAIINKLSIKQEINKIKNKYSLTDETFQEFVNNRELNTVQIYLVQVFYSSKFRVGSNKTELFYLVYGMMMELREMNFEIIPDILSCSVFQNSRKMNNRKKLVEQVISSDKYTFVLKNYLQVKNIMDTNNSILSLMTIKNSRFVTEDGEELNIPTKQLSEEVLDLVLCI